ncbi:MAG: bifunctional diaminohydroxyphosphoribosylaminopyrimidine deaminase/5-amino-6-(5-phosphoribosylamino)uracil reductase RibD [Proteobacteria bacterium]|nr:bifunctional diaminohydroxyphosphoribosylaminopyrimidine deaminase/5-amino-6-(5-phosphoribosylamino)uracil reductase RibD [Pseudomonadota bacterium]
MRAALALARRGLGSAWPNPTVGCVLVKDGRVLGRGWTQPGGRPHAETEALGRAGAAARGATAYISLEPCSHWGKTPPCSEAFVAAGIARAVIAVKDPDPRVNGAGIARLAEAGTAVEVGLLAEEAAEVNAGFFMRIAEGRPLVTLKTATTLDARIATARGESRWITGETARAFAHALRARHDAIMIGTGTLITDDPALTCRLPGLERRSPVRVILDARLRLPLTAKVVATAREVPTWLVTLAGAGRARADAYRGAGVEVMEVAAGADQNPDLKAVLRALGGRGLTRLLVEGGERLSAALLREGLVDRIAWFRAPTVMGGDGLPFAAGIGIASLAAMRRFARTDRVDLGSDVFETYRRVD